MTVTELVAVQDYWETPRAKREAATAAYVQSCQAGSPLNGKQLATEFGMSDSWGRDIVREAKQQGAKPRPAEQQLVTDCQVADSARGERSVTDGSVAPADEAAEVVEPTTPDTDWLGTALSLFVALVAFVVSYGHLYDVALASGESEHLAKLYPLCIDVLAIAAYRAGPRGRRWMLFAVALSVLGNVGSRFTLYVDDIGPAVAVVPVVVAYGAHSLISGKEA